MVMAQSWRHDQVYGNADGTGRMPQVKYVPVMPLIHLTAAGYKQPSQVAHVSSSTYLMHETVLHAIRASKVGLCREDPCIFGAERRSCYAMRSRERRNTSAQQVISMLTNCPLLCGTPNRSSTPNCRRLQAQHAAAELM
eukprot:364180-Chlamydomonas_euryale.AAC.17